jgi:inward rectifier potassium channel
MNLEHLKRKRKIVNTGFDNTNQNAGRILNKDGRTNVIKSGIPFFKRYSTFHALLDMSWGKFLILVFVAFFLINALFAAIYYWLGTDYIGAGHNLTAFEKYLEAFFFSAQTISSVGYGRLNPLGIGEGLVSSIEAFIGLLLFAVLTGLVYARYSKPQAFMLFSKVALIAPFKEGNAFMFRIATYKYNSLTELEVEVVVSMQIENDGKVNTQFFPMKLEFAKVTTLALNWTIVHMIDEESPIYGFDKENFEKNKVEVIVFFKAFDEHFSNVVKEKSSYIHDEIIMNAKFKPMFRKSENGMHTILELDKIDDYQLL